VRTECPRCGHPIPLNAPLARVICATCSNAVEVPDALWRDVLTACDDDLPTLVNTGERTEADRAFGSLRVRLAYRAGTPACPRCAVPFPPHVAEGAAPHDFLCTRCGHGASAYPAPSWLRGLVPTATHVVAGERGGTALASGVDGRVHDEVKPVVMPCPQCDAAFHLTGASERTVACQFCHVDVYLPDDLWRRLHPVKTVSEWFVRFEGLSSAELRASVAAQLAAERCERDRQAEQREAAQRAEREVALWREIDGALHRGYVGVVVLYAVLVLANLWVWFAHLVSSAAFEVGLGLAAASVAGIFVSVSLAARPVELATKYDYDMMLFVAWFDLIVGFAVPVFGSVFCLSGAIKHFKGEFAEATITEGARSRYYPPKRLIRGETLPLAYAHLAVGVLWPTLVAGLIVGLLAGWRH
jgi:hypothetical protein